MKLSRIRAPRHSLAWLAVLCMALPATAYLQRLTVFFEAGFDGSSAPGTGMLPADVGQFSVVAQPGEFTVVAGKGGGELKIDDNGTTAAAVLEAQFKKLFKGQELDFEWTVQALQADATLIVSAQDAGDTGLIDCSMDDDGTLDVDGIDTGFVYQPGSTYQMRLNLKDPLAGSGSWNLEVKADGQLLFQTSGPFNPSSDFTAKSMKFTRPANDHAGKFLVDDIRVSTLSYVANY